MLNALEDVDLERFVKESCSECYVAQFRKKTNGEAILRLKDGNHFLFSAPSNKELKKIIKDKISNGKWKSFIERKKDLVYENILFKYGLN